MKRSISFAAILLGSHVCQAIPTVELQPKAAATTASATSTTCKTFAITTTPASYHCDIGGTLKHPETIGVPSNLPGAASKALTVCRNRCLGSSKCLSFAVDANSSQCILYMETLASQGIIHPGKDTGTIHYDRDCFTSTCALVTVTTSSATQTTTSTTSAGSPGCGSVPAPTFGLLVVGGTHDGLHGFLTGNDQIYNRELQFTEYNTTANQVFALDSDCHLTNDNGIAHTYLNASETDFLFDTAEHIAAATNPQQIPATCDTSSGYLTCFDQSDNTLCLTTDAPNHIDIGPSIPDGGGCVAISLRVLFM